MRLRAVFVVAALVAPFGVASRAEATPPQFSSTAVAISDTGWIVGEVHVANSQRCVESDTNVCVHAAIFATDAGRIGVRDLGTLGGPSSRFAGVNSRGQIVGSAETAQSDPDVGGNVFRAVLSNGGGPLVDLGTLGGNNSQAEAIDEHGTVVGQAETAAGAFHAFVKYPGQPMTDLGTLGGGFSAASAISRNGRYIAGFSGTSTGAFHGFLWDGRIHDLGPLPGGTYTVANAVNSAGDVVGSSGDDEGNNFAVIWQRGTVRKLVDYHGGYDVAAGIADSGKVVGFANPPTGKTRGFMTDTYGGTAKLLGALGTHAGALGVDNIGDAVGDSEVGHKLDPNGNQRFDAVLYQNGNVIDLAT
ncbi:MAG TPA: hypothetical protein VHD87_11965 [Acidimicrobiales bacterium]|nr:hypothetical protein [Acidimicrobiales bacterium]